jgi:hypothetical protein
MRRSVSRLLHRQLAAAFGAWHSEFAEQRTCFAVIRRSLTRLLHRQLATAWLSWHGAWAERRAHLRVMRRSLTRLLHRQLAASWCTWADHAAQRIVGMRRLRHAATKLTHRQLARAFASWPRRHAEQAHAESAERLATAERHAAVAAAARASMEEGYRQRMSELTAERDALVVELETLKRQFAAAQAAAGAAQVQLMRTPQESEEAPSPRPELSDGQPEHAEWVMRLLLAQRDEIEARLQDVRRPSTAPAPPSGRCAASYAAERRRKPRL